MGFSATTSQNKCRRKRNAIITPNVVPFIDVMLVLLVIFMITSPMIVAGVKVDLPETKSSPISEQSEPLVISVDKKGDLYILETKIDPSQITDKLKSITKEKKDTRIFIRGDKNVPYGEIVRVVSEINTAGYTKVALISNIKLNEKR